MIAIEGPHHLAAHAKRASVLLSVLDGRPSLAAVEVRDMSKNQRLLGVYYWRKKQFTSPAFNGFRKSKGHYETFQIMRSLAKRHSADQNSKAHFRPTYDPSLPPSLCRAADDRGLMALRDDTKPNQKVCLVYSKSNGFLIGRYYYASGGRWYAGDTSGISKTWENAFDEIWAAWSRCAAEPQK